MLGKQVVNNLSKRIERFDPSNVDNINYYWKGKRIIPLNQWIELKRTPYVWKYFPDDFNHFWTYLSNVTNSFRYNILLLYYY